MCASVQAAVRAGHLQASVERRVGVSLCDLWLHRVGVAGPEGFGPPETRLADIKLWSTATASVTSQTALREWLSECLCEVMQCGELL